MWEIDALLVIAVVLCLYVFYSPFQDWTYVRFFLPAYPFLFITLLSATKMTVSGVNNPADRVVLPHTP